MSRSIVLGDRVHCRFGDKGNTGLFVLAPYDLRDLDWLIAGATPERLAAFLGGMEPSQVRCHPCRQLGAVVVEVRDLLAGGVTASLAIDAHGKTLAGYLLAMSIPY